MLALKDVSMSYGKQKVLQQVSLSLKPKETICIIGNADSGKTTLLRLLLRDIAPLSGTVEADNVDLQLIPDHILPLYRRRFGVKFQGGELLRARTVAENIALPLEIHQMPQKEIDQVVHGLLEQFHLTSVAKCFPNALTKQHTTLTSLARALAGSPMILLLDEPLEDLDDAHRTLALSAIHEQKGDATTIAFSRDAALASALGARLVHLENGTLKEEDKTDTGSILNSHNIFTKFTIPLIKKRQEAESETATPPKKVRVTAIHSK